ncbi:MAG: hypothetical protein KGJ86_15860, partial [Chloroflexota bacterium]|nr:hypothetical protein [Chloroflexota bacterium]
MRVFLRHPGENRAHGHLQVSLPALGVKLEAMPSLWRVDDTTGNPDGPAIFAVRQNEAILHLVVAMVCEEA